MVPILYSFRRCPYAMRARLSLLHCNMPYEHREILLKAKPAALLAASPKGTVPVLLTHDADTGVIDESIDIMRWVYCQQGIATMCGQACEALITRNDQEFKYWLDRYKYAERHPELTLEQSRAKAVCFIEALEARLAQNDFLSGDVEGFVDYAIMPFVRQFAAVDSVWFDAQHWPRTQYWLARLCASTLFERVMTKHPLWKPEDTVND
ncbi:glutathione S-transferase [Marinagarivorans algicola]|uniref:glutathione S-transferase n=1 Tax=Marinagarivorans algicola TaxID=1513270 RepID=UPI0006B4A5BB|nr:glutathione S-transferase [Marinagarivorans algicola]